MGLPSTPGDPTAAISAIPENVWLGLQEQDQQLLTYQKYKTVLHYIWLYL